MITEIALMIALSASDMFDRMLTLAGEWEGQYEWTDGRSGSGDLRMTHFCAARNQPRLKSSAIADAPPAAEFAILDVTGNTKFGSVQAFRIEILDENHLNLSFTFRGNPKTSGVEHIALTRLKLSS